MFRLALTTLRPLRLIARPSLCAPSRFRIAPFQSFATQKPDNNGEPSTDSKPAEPAKEESLKSKSVDELIQLNTEESLLLVEKRAQALEEQNKKQKNQIAELEEHYSYFEKHHSDLTAKETQLIENIKAQEEELARIKKRADKELADSKDYAITKLASEIMEVADNIKRCQAFAEQKIKENPDDKYYQKIILSKKQIDEFLKLYDIEEFDPTGLPFDPNTSESLLTIPTPPGYTVNNVATTMRTGYRIKTRLLRSARVGIFV